MSYEVGSVYRSTCTVKDENGDPTTPTSITLTITKPDQTTTGGSPVEDDTGVYHGDYNFAGEGLHKLVWETTGPITHKTDYVNASIWRSVLGIDETKNYINDSDADRDPILRHIMAAATELAEDVVGLTVPKTFTDEQVTGYQRLVIRLPHAPLVNDTAVTSITSVWTGGPSWATADLIVYPDSGTVEPLNMLGFYFGPWKATYLAGRSVISQKIQLAVKEIIFDLWSIQRPYGANYMEPSPEDTARFEQMLATYVIPPHARAMLESEEIPGFA